MNNVLRCVKKCKIENSKSVAKKCPCNENETKCDENDTKCHETVCLKKTWAVKEKVFDIILFRFFVDISESIHLIFTGIQANEITNFSASIGTNLDKIWQKLSNNGP